MIQEFDRQHFRFNAWLHHGAMNDIPWKKCFLVSAVVLTMPFQGCKSLPKEVKYLNAEPGDALVVSEGTTIALYHAF